MRIIDLFSGAGGLTFGFYYRIKQNKFVRNRKNSFVFANELDPFAAEAFKANFPDIRMINEDIKQLDKDTIEQMIGEEPVDLIIGGPPCQSFSTVGQRVFDEKATLYEEYLRILSIAKPKIFLFENVKGMLSMRETFYKKDKDGNIVYEVKKNKETGSERKYPVVEGYGRKIIDIIKNLDDLSEVVQHSDKGMKKLEKAVVSNQRILSVSKIISKAGMIVDNNDASKQVELNFFRIGTYLHMCEKKKVKMDNTSLKG